MLEKLCFFLLQEEENLPVTNFQAVNLPADGDMQAITIRGKLFCFNNYIALIHVWSGEKRMTAETENQTSLK